jgi:hypothetical protein
VDLIDGVVVRGALGLTRKTGGREKRAKATAKTEADPYGMANKKETATARARAGKETVHIPTLGA